MNSIDQFSPYGSTTFQRNADGTPKSQTVTLSPEMQGWLDSQFNTSTKLQDATSKQLDYLPTDKFALPTGTSADSLARGAFGDAVLDPSSFDTSKIAQTSYDQSKSLMQPDIDAARKSKEIELGRRGIPVGSEIYRDEMNRLDTQANNAYAGASRQATLDAGNEQTRAIGNATTARNYGNNQYQTDLGNQLLERSRPFEEAASLMGSTPSFSSPSFMNTSAQSIAAPDYQGAVNSNYQAQLQQSANQNNALGGILGSVAGAGAKFLTSPTASIAGYSLWSDENLKEDREPADGEGILASLREMPIDDYAYREEAVEALDVPEHRTGAMAQDWQREFGGDGRTIDVGDAIGKLLAAMKTIDQRTQHLKQGQA